MTYRDRLPGGLADERRPSDFDPKELRRGIRVEMEHTKDRKIAREIAMDHLTEDEAYYEKLEALERSTFRMQANPHPLANKGDWFPASGGTERPFTTRTGRRLQYVWQPRTGAHAYYDVDRDIILSDEEARQALGTFSDNPRRPPKAWFDSCVRGVERSGGAYDPKAVCGAQWQKKSEAEKRRLSRGREECSECLDANPIGGAGTALIIGGAAALAYFLFLRPAKAAKPATTPATCAIDPQKLDAWARARGFYVLYFPQADTAPPFDDDFEQALVRKYPGIEDIPDIELKQFVAVIRDGSFWYYLITGVGDEGIEKGRADNLRADYCAFSGTQTVSGGYGPYAALS